MAARDPRGLREAIDRRLLDLIDAAVRHLPAGWGVEVVPADWRRGVEPSPLAIAVQLVDPEGRYIPALTRDKHSAVYALSALRRSRVLGAAVMGAGPREPARLGRQLHTIDGRMGRDTL